MYRYIYLYVSKKSFRHLSTRNHQVSIHYKKVSEETLYNLLDGFISCTPPEFGTRRTPLSHYTQHPLHFISTIHNKSTITTSLSEHIQFSYMVLLQVLCLVFTWKGCRSQQTQTGWIVAQLCLPAKISAHSTPSPHIHAHTRSCKNRSVCTFKMTHQ